MVRCYSISDGLHHADYYRVTIKKEKAPPDKPDLPPGAASSFFCDAVKEGDILSVKAPTAHSFPDVDEEQSDRAHRRRGHRHRQSAAQAIAASGSKREAWFSCGSQHAGTYPQSRAGKARRRAREHPSARLLQPARCKRSQGRDYQYAGRVSIELLKELLPSNNFEYYLCGNGAFMKSISDGLEAWGVPEKEVHFEAFGPATVKKKAAQPTSTETVFLSRLNVTFSRSGKTVHWEPSAGNLLDFARSQGHGLIRAAVPGVVVRAWSPSTGQRGLPETAGCRTRNRAPA